MNDIFKMAQQAYHALSIAESELKRLYKENAELKNSLNREWVGLTDDERSYYLQAAANVGWWQASLFIEAKLKNKNYE